ncbi:hypothetical protein B0H16DRAFT_1458134 [Mycena metata]|uniref:Uncharacterized protein n=1 Tax=Mycena metata TaxID=1033252 RepID=A0AAD7J5F3_9AGAR|nr:hypothetical protein B0H16DRAFT_1458134 [Mycena metata]
MPKTDSRVTDLRHHFAEGSEMLHGSTHDPKHQPGNCGQFEGLRNFGVEFASAATKHEDFEAGQDKGCNSIAIGTIQMQVHAKANTRIEVGKAGEVEGSKRGKCGGRLEKSNTRQSKSIKVPDGKNAASISVRPKGLYGGSEFGKGLAKGKGFGQRVLQLKSDICRAGEEEKEKGQNVKSKSRHGQRSPQRGSAIYNRTPAPANTRSHQFKIGKQPPVPTEREIGEDGDERQQLDRKRVDRHWVNAKGK